MKRRNTICLTFALVLAGCRENSTPLNVFPETAAGGWKRVSVHDAPASEGPDPVPRSGVTRFQSAVYEGPGKLEARAYELNSPAIGLDMTQRWRPSADTVFFNQGKFFIVIKWEKADRAQLQDFVRDLEKRIPK